MHAKKLIRWNMMNYLYSLDIYHAVFSYITSSVCDTCVASCVPCENQLIKEKYGNKETETPRPTRQG